MKLKNQFFEKLPIHSPHTFHSPHTLVIGKNGLIEFSQNGILNMVTSGKLNNIKIKYNGLCEIICNYILLEDLLGKNDPLPLQEDVQASVLNIQPGAEQLGINFKDSSKFVQKYKNKYGELITLENLKKVENTHILQVTHFFTRLIAVLFSIYPCNLFSNGFFSKPPYKNIKLVNGKTQTQVDEVILSERLSQLESGFYIKFFAFKKHGLSMDGHSMLIKKIDDNQYTFFDPNHGEYVNLSIDELVVQINKSTQENSANHLVFLDAREFVNTYQITKVESEAETKPGLI